MGSLRFDRRWVTCGSALGILMCIACVGLGLTYWMRLNGPNEAGSNVSGAMATPLTDAAIGDITVSSEFTGGAAQADFAQADVIYAHFIVAPGRERRLIHGAMTTVAVEGHSPGTVLLEYEEAVPAGEEWIAFAYSLPWPLGRYRLDLDVDGVRSYSTEIQVVGTNTAGAQISNVFTARDQAGAQPAQSFPQVSSVFVHFTLTNALDSTQVKGVMVARQAASLKPDTRITETSGELGNGAYWFEFFNNSPWPIGSYTIFIYLNGQFASQFDLQVE